MFTYRYNITHEVSRHFEFQFGPISYNLNDYSCLTYAILIPQKKTEVPTTDQPPCVPVYPHAHIQ